MFKLITCKCHLKIINIYIYIVVSALHTVLYYVGIYFVVCIDL